MAECKILLTLVSAKGLRASDEGGTSDPYCIFHYMGRDYMTNVEYKTTNPEWGTKIELMYKSGADKKITLTVLDYDKTLWDQLAGEASEPDVLGNLEIDLTPAIDQPGQVVSKTLDLVDSTGSVTYTLCGEKLSGPPAAKPPPPPAAPPQKPQAPPTASEDPTSSKIDCLEFLAVSATGVRGADSIDKKSDPLVIVHWRGKKYSSTHKKKTLTPVWNEVIALPYKDTDEKKIAIEVMDFDFGRSDDFLGNCTIDISDHKVDQLYTSELQLQGPNATGSIILKTKLCEKKPAWTENAKYKFVKVDTAKKSKKK